MLLSAVEERGRSVGALVAIASSIAVLSSADFQSGISSLVATLWSYSASIDVYEKPLLAQA